MKEKDLSEENRIRIKNYKLYFNSWLKEHAQRLSPNSIKLYSRSISLVAIHLLPESQEDINLTVMLKALEDSYDLSKDSLPNIEIDTNLNNVNTLLNAIGKLIRMASNVGDISDKLKILEEHIKKRSISLRDTIADIKSNNSKSEMEQDNMKPFEDYVKVAQEIFQEYKSSIKKAKEYEDFEEAVRSLVPKLKFRNAILVTLILLNKTKVEGVLMHSILRLVEYTDLYLWTSKDKPPMDGKNYFSIKDRVIYLQHNKTTGGLKFGEIIQPTFKKFKIFNKQIVDMIKLYSEIYEINNNTPLFTSTTLSAKGDLPLNKTALSKLLKVIFSSIADHTTIGLIRKSYDNRNLQLTHKQFKKTAKLNDHSVETIQTFYKKV